MIIPTSFVLDTFFQVKMFDNNFFKNQCLSSYLSFCSFNSSPPSRSKWTQLISIILHKSPMMLVQLLVEVEELAALWDTLSVNVVSTAITAEPQVKFVMMTVASKIGLKKTQSRN